jgi:catechol 2,3-dioxygenase-like lactoylglutathione lyase family enzyme
MYAFCIAGGRKMPKVCMIQIGVSDMDQAIEWYCNRLGFEISKEHNYYPVAIDLVHEGTRLLLHKAAKSTHIDYPNIAQTLICIQTNDIAASLDDLKSKGVELIHKTPLDFPAGKYAAFKDPFGNVHELVEFFNY